MDTLKLEIKNWEHQFRKEHNRNPSKADIQANKDIQNKYKQYRSYKAHGSKIYKTPTKTRSNRQQLQTPQRTSPINRPDSSPVLAKEIGPTPQMNGVVLSIFDGISSPNVTPVKSTRTFAEGGDIQMSGTPTRKLNFSRIMEGYQEEGEINSDDDEDPVEQKETSQFKTPQKTRVLDFVTETPAYLKTSQNSVMMGATPSPLASQRMRKGLSTIIDELRDIQDELKYGDFDTNELVPIEEEASEEEVEEEINGKIWKKRKTQKRQTRRVKMKARKIKEVDEMSNKNVHDEIQKLEEEKALLREMHWSDDSEEDEAAEEEVYVRQPWEPVDPSKQKQRNNFVRLKINKKKFFGKKGSW